MKMSLNVLTSFLIWTSVFVMGVLVSATLLKTVLAASRTVYHLLHS